LPIGAYVSAHHDSLRALEEKFALLDEMELSRRSDKKEIEDLSTTLLTKTASKDSFTLLQNALNAMSAEMQVLQSTVSTKAEKSEIYRLQSAASDLTTFGAFHSAATNDIKTLFSLASENKKMIDNYNEQLSKFSSILSNYATIQLQKVDRDSFQSASTKLNDIDAKVAFIESKLKEIETSTLVSSKSIDTSVRSMYESLSAELGLKAYTSTIEATDEAIASVATHVETLEKKIDLALKFIDWYVEKGTSSSTGVSAPQAVNVSSTSSVHTLSHLPPSSSASHSWARKNSTNTEPIASNQPTSH
jgi:hypothetical protein